MLIGMLYIIKGLLGTALIVQMLKEDIKMTENENWIYVYNIKSW